MSIVGFACSVGDRFLSPITSCPGHARVWYKYKRTHHTLTRTCMHAYKTTIIRKLQAMKWFPARCCCCCRYGASRMRNTFTPILFWYNRHSRHTYIVHTYTHTHTFGRWICVYDIGLNCVSHQVYSPRLNSFKYIKRCIELQSWVQMFVCGYTVRNLYNKYTSVQDVGGIHRSSRIAILLRSCVCCTCARELYMHANLIWIRFHCRRLCRCHHHHHHHPFGPMFGGINACRDRRDTYGYGVGLHSAVGK